MGVSKQCEGYKNKTTGTLSLKARGSYLNRAILISAGGGVV